MSRERDEEALRGVPATLGGPESFDPLESRLSPAVAPNGEPYDHDCAFRHMVRAVAGMLDVPQLPNGNYADGEMIFDRLLEAANLWRTRHGLPQIEG